MKPIAALAGVLLLFGCAQNISPWGEASQTTERPFSSQATVNWEEKKYAAKIVKSTDGALSVTLTSEDLLCPVEIRCGEGAASLKLGDLSLTLEAQAALPAGLTASLLRALKRLGAARFDEQEKTLSLSSGPVCLILEKNSRKFQEMTLERGQVDFFDFVFLD